MINISVNLTGSFDGKVLNEEAFLKFEHIPSLSDIFKELNLKYSIRGFSAKAIKKRQIVLLVDGEPIKAKELKRQVKLDEIITIVQPIIGG